MEDIVMIRNSWEDKWLAGQIFTAFIAVISIAGILIFLVFIKPADYHRYWADFIASHVAFFVSVIILIVLFAKSTKHVKATQWDKYYYYFILPLLLFIQGLRFFVILLH